MFTTIRNTLLQKRNLLFRQFLITIRFISTDSPTPKQSFTISYLINSCGLSQQRAISLSKKLQFDSSANPDSVLTLLRDYGFTDSHISKTISQRPGILLYSVDNTLKPKFDFFISKGFCGEDLAKALSVQAGVLGCSLEEKIIPVFSFLKSIVGTDEKVIAMLKRSMNVIQSIKTVESNIQILQAHGIPMSNIVKLLVSQPRALFRNPSSFMKRVEEVSKMKICPSQYTFLQAIHILESMSRSTLEAKFDVYKSWGWSEDQVKLAFRKNPNCMILSKENIMSSMDIFVNKMGYNRSSIANRSIILQYSLEKRIIPRCSVIQVLIKAGCVEKLPNIHTALRKTEDAFLKSFITKFEKRVPELMNVYKGKIRG